ncbi:transglycosylase domain-containing protein [bacterium]|nr:transglycosylase domain-containing protein [bacterium]
MIKYPARILLGCLLVYLACILPLKISLWFFPLPLQVLEKDYATLHLDSTDQLMRISLSPSDKYRIRLPLSEMADELKRGFLIFEDKYFYSHPGVNPVAIMRAWLVNARHGRVLMGGSTITMQIAKMMEPKPRTLPSKIIEVMRAFQLEGVYTKDELLELYLNLVPMGGNIEGVGAAAYLYFGKAAGQLSFAECSLLIGLPKSPCQFQPNKFPRAARQQRNKVMQRIAPDLNISAKQLSAAYSAPVPQQRFTNPYLCPQLIVRKRHQGPEFVKKYTIDSHLQSFCELQLKHTSEYNKKRDIHNGAINATTVFPLPTSPCNSRNMRRSLFRSASISAMAVVCELVNSKSIAPRTFFLKTPSPIMGRPLARRMLLRTRPSANWLASNSS